MNVSGVISLEEGVWLKMGGAGMSGGSERTDRGDVELSGEGISRRQFIAGSAVVSLLIAGSTAIAGCSSSQEETDGSVEPTDLDVSEDSVVLSSDFEELDYSSCITETASFDIAMGSVGNIGDGTLGVVLSPGATSDVLVSLGLLSVSSATLNTVLESAVSHSEGFQIYDARGNNQVIVWVESNLHTGDWRVYVATVDSSAAIGSAVLVDEGDSDFDPPMLCVCGGWAFWTVMPSTSGSATASDSYLKKASPSSSTPEVVYTSHGRMITNPQATDGIVTIVPRANTSSTRYQLTALDATSGEVLAAQRLPGSMRAYDAIYMDGSFLFSIEQTYSYGGGIANFGTYAQIDDTTWMRFNRTPMDTPVRCGRFTLIKSTSSVVGVDLDTQQYFAIPVPSDCESYGDFLMSSGLCDNFVIYTSIPTGDGSGDGVVRVRAYSVI